MSAWADYFREKGLLVVENDKGFMSAIVQGDICMVDNFYVAPPFRGTRAAFNITNALVTAAIERGCRYFSAEIYKTDPMYNYILRLHKHFGMEPIEDTQFKTVTCRPIGGVLC